MSTVHVCPHRDIECGESKGSWCLDCPKWVQFLAAKQSYIELDWKGALNAAAERIKQLEAEIEKLSAPSLTRDEGMRLLEEYARAKRDFEIGCRIEFYAPAVEACLKAMGVK